MTRFHASKPPVRFEIPRPLARTTPSRSWTSVWFRSVRRTREGLSLPDGRL